TPRARPRPVRRQVWTNVLIDIDEGEGLVQELNDPKSKVAAVLRSLWSGANAGQNNAAEGTTRFLLRGRYSFGLIAGFQLSLLAGLFTAAHTNLGTSQRGVAAWSGAPDIPDERPENPGPLTVTVPAGQITLCAELLAEVDGMLVAQLRAGGTDD